MNVYKGKLNELSPLPTSTLQNFKAKGSNKSRNSIVYDNLQSSSTISYIQTNDFGKITLFRNEEDRLTEINKNTN